MHEEERYDDDSLPLAFFFLVYVGIFLYHYNMIMDNFLRVEEEKSWHEAWHLTMRAENIKKLFLLKKGVLVVTHRRSHFRHPTDLCERIYISRAL
jgi:hypothetical protein